jgi:hypothetical protein
LRFNRMKALERVKGLRPDVATASCQVEKQLLACGAGSMSIIYRSSGLAKKLAYAGSNLIND